MFERKQRRPRRLRGAAIAMALSAVVGASLMAPAAQAYTPVKTWTEFLGASTWGAWQSSPVKIHDHVSAWYGGAGTVAVCEQAQVWNGATWVLVSQICANNSATGGNLAAYNGLDLRARGKNDSGSAHTIDGAIYQP